LLRGVAKVPAGSVVSTRRFGPVQLLGYFCAGLSIERAFEELLLERFRQPYPAHVESLPDFGNYFQEIYSVGVAG